MIFKEARSMYILDIFIMDPPSASPIQYPDLVSRPMNSTSKQTASNYAAGLRMAR